MGQVVAVLSQPGSSAGPIEEVLPPGPGGAAAQDVPSGVPVLSGPCRGCHASCQQTCRVSWPSCPGFCSSWLAAQLEPHSTGPPKRRCLSSFPGLTWALRPVPAGALRHSAPCYPSSSVIFSPCLPWLPFWAIPVSLPVSKVGDSDTALLLWPLSSVAIVTFELQGPGPGSGSQVLAGGWSLHSLPENGLLLILLPSFLSAAVIVTLVSAVTPPDWTIVRHCFLMWLVSQASPMAISIIYCVRNVFHAERVGLPAVSLSFSQRSRFSKLR